jgi:hypothetical protein
MYRATPVTNRVLDDKWQRLQLDKMQQRLQSTRGMVFSQQRTRMIRSPSSTNTSTVFSPIKFIINRAKRDQMMEGNPKDVLKPLM